MQEKEKIKQKNPIIITGPTASGKSEAALLLASQIGGEIISADSMQVYKGMDIGTAKVEKADQELVRHHLLDILEPGELFNVISYQKLAQVAIKDILARGKQPIICGGTSQYISALVEGLTFSPARADFDLRKRLSQQDIVALRADLARVDPEAAAKIGQTDKKRLVRALEIYQLTGKTKTWHDLHSRREAPAYQYKTYILNRDRPILYNRINQRVDKMMDKGLLDEVKMLARLDLPPDSTCLQAIGYKELLAYLKGKCSLEEAVSKIQQASRNYAKPQLTLLRRMQQAIWLDNKTAAEAADLIKEQIELD